MKRLALIGLVLSPALLYAITDQTNTFYVRLDGGYDFTNNPTVTTASYPSGQIMTGLNSAIGNSAAYGAGVGYQFNPTLRIDITVNYRPGFDFKLTDNAGEIGQGKTNNTTAMLNLYYDFVNSHPVTPYVMAGFGMSENTTNPIFWPLAGQFEDLKTMSQLAWQAGGGFAYQMTRNLNLDCNFQVADLGIIKNTGTYEYSGGLRGSPTKWNELYAYQFQIGLRYYMA